MGLAETYQQTAAALGGTGPMLPPGTNPLVPPEAYAAPQLPAGFEMGPAGMRAIAPAGFQYNAGGGLEPIPAQPPAPPPIQTSLIPAVAQASAAPYAAPPPIPEAPPEASKGRGKGKSKKVEDVLDLIFAAAKNNHFLGSLTVAQVDAIREVVEGA